MTKPSLSLKDKISISLDLDKTFLTEIKTASIFCGLATILFSKNNIKIAKFILVIVLILQLLSIFEYIDGYKKFEIQFNKLFPNLNLYFSKEILYSLSLIIIILLLIFSY